MIKIAIPDPNLQASQEYISVPQPLTVPEFPSTITTGHKIQNNKQKYPVPISAPGM